MKLSRKQIEQLIQDTSSDYRGKNLYGRCPKCGHNEFGISLEDNHLFNCFRKKKCGFQGNIYTLLKFLGRAKEFLSEREINIFEKLESGINRVESISLDLPKIAVPLFWKRVFEHEYLRERGFTDEQFQKFEVGTSILMKDYVTFLVRMNGEVVGHISRSVKSREWIDDYNKKAKDNLHRRYLNSNTDFSKCLFGYDEITSKTTDVILVEGVFSKTKTDYNLSLDNVDFLKCCATFGGKLSSEQIQLLKIKNVKRIWLWIEADILPKVKKIAAEASLYFDVMVSYIGDVDPGDMNKEQAEQCLASAMNWLDFNMGYIKSNLHENT